jgi:hypothetical protein
MSAHGLPWCYSDGGRVESGRRGDAGDCVTRSIAIVTGIDYDEVYRYVAAQVATAGRSKSARNGVPKKVTRKLMEHFGGVWTPTMTIGSGTTVHLAQGELPETERIVAQVTKHVTAVIYGVVLDTYDPTREGTRAVYGYWTFPPLARELVA